jgi:hypothetical protein
VGAGGRRGVFRCMSWDVHRQAPSAGIALAPTRHAAATTQQQRRRAQRPSPCLARECGAAVPIRAKKLFSRKLRRGASLAQILRCRDRRLSANGGEPSASIIPTLCKATRVPFALRISFGHLAAKDNRMYSDGAERCGRPSPESRASRRFAHTQWVRPPRHLQDTPFAVDTASNRDGRRELWPTIIKRPHPPHLALRLTRVVNMAPR